MFLATWHSATEYLAEVTRASWSALLGVGFASVGALRELGFLPNSAQVPAWMWWVAAFLCVTWAQFLAFHRARSERDDAPVDVPQLDHVTNGRFGFDFSYPTTWARKDPINSDGNTFVDITDSRIEYRVYGSYFGAAISKDGSTSLWNLVQRVEKQIGDHGGRILRSMERGTWLYFPAATENGIKMARLTLQGWLFEYERQGSRHFHAITTHGNVEYHLICTAPRSVFGRYRPLFVKMLSDFAVFDSHGNVGAPGEPH